MHEFVGVVGVTRSFEMYGRLLGVVMKLIMYVHAVSDLALAIAVLMDSFVE
jgi:hypothetical protein